jgi:superfamily II DNA/RNA helicase
VTFFLVSSKLENAPPVHLAFVIQDSTMDFARLNLPPALLEVVKAMGFAQATPVQELCIPTLLKAETSSDKPRPEAEKPPRSQ